jgi:hypothetical protein
LFKLCCNPFFSGGVSKKPPVPRVVETR